MCLTTLLFIDSGMHDLLSPPKSSLSLFAALASASMSPTLPAADTASGSSSVSPAPAPSPCGASAAAVLAAEPSASAPAPDASSSASPPPLSSSPPAARDPVVGLEAAAAHSGKSSGGAEPSDASGLINYAKRRKVAEIIRDITLYQNTPYNLNVQPHIRVYSARVIFFLLSFISPIPFLSLLIR